jgi:valine--pyruvate aminotransferase
MNETFSEAGGRLAARSGILDLMDDLGRALTTDPGMRMLGGGNPAHIGAVDAVWRRRMGELMADGDALERMLGNYDPPRGNPVFLEALAGLLRESCGWPVTPEHLAVTTGGQTALFFLFNLFGGVMSDGTRRRILLPLVPEYIGYANQGLGAEQFAGCPAVIERTGEHEFKYRVDFGAVEATLEGGGIGAICVSRPTNPTGNVLTDGEMERLLGLAKRYGVPLIIDNAYGLPFPGAVFTEATPLWDEQVILTLSLSKLGLPGTRTGMVVASPRTAAAVAAMTSVTGLANSNAGQQLVLPLMRSGELLAMSREVIRPFYEGRAAAALGWLAESFAGVRGWSVHRTEGAFFLWLRVEGLPVTSLELYERLKARKVLVVPGEHFFFGLKEEWGHRHECVRLNYSGPEAVVREGLAIIADEVRALQRGEV